MFSEYTAVLGLLEKFRDRVAGHELEDRVLRILEECHDLLQAAEHGLIVADCACHAAGEVVAEVVVDVQLAWRARSEEGVVETWFQR